MCELRMFKGLAPRFGFLNKVFLFVFTPPQNAYKIVTTRNFLEVKQ